MIITIHQPDFMPWLGFFERWRSSDLYLILDDVQFLKRGWHNRDRIKGPNGIHWLTVPVKSKGLYNQKINEVLIDYQNNWIYKHLKSIEKAYQKSVNFKSLYSEIEEIYNLKYERLIDLNIELLKLFSMKLNINTPFKFSSEFNVKKTKSERLVEFIKKNDGSTYLTGEGSREYLDVQCFKEKEIDVMWQDFKVFDYKKTYKHFEKNLSVLDFLMMNKFDIDVFVNSYSN